MKAIKCFFCRLSIHAMMWLLAFMGKDTAIIDTAEMKWSMCPARYRRANHDPQTPVCENEKRWNERM